MSLKLNSDDHRSHIVTYWNVFDVDIPGQHEHAHIGDARSGPGADRSSSALPASQHSLQDRLSSRGALRMRLDR